MQICLVFNPVARGDKARHLRRHLDNLAARCVLKPTAKAGDARLLAAQAAQEGFSTIVAAGGDGTLNEVLNGIGDVPGAFNRVRLGVLPLGTVNVFAREMKIPFDVRRAWDIICRGHETAIDLPLAEFVSVPSLSSGSISDKKTERRYFIQLAGAGLDSRAIELVNWELKKKIGPLAYVAAGFQAVRETHPLITAETEREFASGELILLGNGRFYGGNFPLFPKANLQDGLLDTCIFPKANFAQIIRAGFGLLTGRLHQFCQTQQLQSSDVTLRSSSRVILQLDGDNVGELPARISILPRALRVITP